MGLAIGRPGQGQALWRIGSCTSRHFRPQFLHHVLALQIPDLDGRSSSGTKPVPVGTESKSIDGVRMVQGVQMLPIIEVPQHRLGILPPRCTQRTIRAHGYSVQVTCVANVVGLQLAVGQVPDLDVLIPTRRHDDWVQVIWREPHARNPVLMPIFLNGVLALGQCIPQLDGLVPGSRHDLPVERSQSLRVLSQDPERAKWPSEDKTTSEMKWPCPCRSLRVNSLFDYKFLHDL